MKKPDYAKIYENILPNDFAPVNSINFPQFNSSEYRRNAVNRLSDITKNYDRFGLDDDGLVILGCNELTGRTWNSFIIGFKNVDSCIAGEFPWFKSKLDSNLTNIKFVNSVLFVVSFTSGNIQLWSTKSHKTASQYCTFMMDSKCEHIGRIVGMDFLNNNNQLVTGCSEGLLKIWDINNTNICSIHSLHNAHLDTITCISNNGKTGSIFATCSVDKSAFIWDYRQQRPATALIENHAFDFTSIKWCNLTEGNNEMIFVGDATGAINIVDTKMPKKILKTIKVHSRPISKILFNGSHMVVIGETNLLRIYNNTNLKFKVIFEEYIGNSFLRDALWNPKSLNELLVIGWDSTFYRHLIC